MNTIHINLKNFKEEKTVNNKEVMDEKLKEFTENYYLDSYQEESPNFSFNYYASLKTKGINLHLVGVDDEGDNPLYLIREKNGEFNMLEDSWYAKKTVEKFWLYVVVALRSDNEFNGINFFYTLFMMESFPVQHIENAKLYYILKQKIDWDTIKIKDFKYSIKKVWNELLS